jgi:hypothetical protein
VSTTAYAVFSTPTPGLHGCLWKPNTLIAPIHFTFVMLLLSMSWKRNSPNNQELLLAMFWCSGIRYKHLSLSSPSFYVLRCIFIMVFKLYMLYTKWISVRNPRDRAQDTKWILFTNSKPRYIAAVLFYQMQNYLQLLRFLICTLVLTIAWFIF